MAKALERHTGANGTELRAGAVFFFTFFLLEEVIIFFRDPHPVDDASISLKSKVKC